jgi:hypothetical protein
MTAQSNPLEDSETKLTKSPAEAGLFYLQQRRFY